MIIRVDMTAREIKKQDVPEKYALLGGRGLTSRMVLDEVNPLCNPLGPGNKIIIAPGLLGGSAAPCSGRLSIGAKSPLTGGIKESNGGGTAAAKLSKMGIKALVVEGQPEEDKLYLLKVTPEGVELLPADELKGKGNYETVKILKQKYGNNYSILSIGPAGERGYSMASVAITDMEGNPSRHCGRGGMGAVLGSKKIKAVLINDAGARGIAYKSEKEFKQIAREWSKTLVQTKAILTNFGTANLVTPMNALGALPTRNFSAGSFEKAEKISGERLRELLEQRGGAYGHPCHPGCVIRCSNVFKDEKGEYVTSALEYETIGLLGANCGIGNLDLIARLDRFCDDFGIDTMELGVTIGVVMESGMISFGDEKGIMQLIEELEKDSIMGKLIGHGAAVAGRVLGVHRIPSVKGQGISSYDPRALKGTGVTYATSPMGADHTAGNCLPGRKGYRPETMKDFDVTEAEGQWELSKDLQLMTAVCDYCGLCFFVGPTWENMEIISRLINARYGCSLTKDDVIALAKQLIKTEVEFNLRAGIPQSANGLPEFFYREKLGPNELIFDIPAERLQRIFENL